MVSIVIVNWNSGTLLEKAVLSLRKHARDCEIIVVDNASEDSSLDFAENIGPPLAVLRNASNLGFAAANNMGWRHSRGEEVLFLNPDTECFPDSISRMQKSLRAGESLWAVGGRLVNSSGETQVGFNLRTFPTIGSLAAEMFLLDEVWPANPWTRRYRMSDRDYNRAMDVDQPAMACLMVKRSVLESLNGFDERFHPAWFEDVDFCKRIREMGGRVLYEPTAKFLHHGGCSLEHLPPDRFLHYYHSNQIRYFAIHHGQGAARKARALVTAGMYLRGAMSLLKPPPAASSRFRAARMFWSTARIFAAMPGEDR